MNTFKVEDGSLALYLREISRHQTLNSEQEARLAVRIRQGDAKAVEDLVNANLRFVVSVARNYQNQGMPLPDLINEGNLGLIRAAARFDEKKNFKFISYAVWWIRQAILQSLADHSRIVKVPVNRVAIIHRLGKVRNRLEQKFRRLPNTEELAAELSVSESEVAQSLAISTDHASLDAPTQIGGEGAMLDIIEDIQQERPDESVTRMTLEREVGSLLSHLNSREREVIRMYYGVGHETSFTLEEIGERLDLTRERVRQIKETAIRKLQRNCGRHHLRPQMA